MTGDSSARLTLVPAEADGESPAPDNSVELELQVEISESDSGFDLLGEWLESRSVLGLVMPAETQIVRLRSLEDLRPLTLRRLDT